MSARRQIIAALSGDSLGGIATLADVTHAEQLADAHAAEVLASDGQAYDGELAMLRGLVRTLRTVVREPNTFDEVRRLLWEHASDETAAYKEAQEKAIPAGTTATPDFFQAEHTYQRDIYEFRCHAIAPDPHSGEPRAIGLRSRNGFPWTGAAMDPDDWAHGGWADVTESGDGRD